MLLEEALHNCPLIAILRGIRPHEAVAIGKALVDIGFTCLEVPLNSPEDPLSSIYHLSQSLAGKALIGAGTVLKPQQIHEVARAGGRLIISPHTDPAVIQTAKKNGLYCIPGFSTPTEAFSAIQAGADALKFFPATTPATLKAITAILPSEIAVFPVGGINPQSMQAYKQAGATGFGLGAALYQPGDSPQKVAQAAQIFYDAIRHLS